MSKKNDRLKRLARRAEHLEKRIAEGVASGKDLTWDRSEASAIRFALQHIETLEADLAAIDDSLKGHKAFNGDRATAIESLIAQLDAAREEIARKDEAQGHLARLCSERLDKILELERQLVNEKTAHAWTEVREQAAIDAARAGGKR